MDIILRLRIVQLGFWSLKRGVAVDRVPVLARSKALAVNVSEARGCQRALGPAAVDGGKMPLDGFGRGVAVELGADVDETLDRGYVDVIDGTEVEDDGAEDGPVVVVVDLLATSWA